MAKPNYVQQAWNQFREVNFSSNPPEDYVREMRRAFYAGADEVFRTVIQIISADDEEDDEDVDHFAAIFDELAEFSRSMKDGGA